MTDLGTLALGAYDATNPAALCVSAVNFMGNIAAQSYICMHFKNSAFAFNCVSGIKVWFH